MSPNLTDRPAANHALSIVVVGNDALIEALPVRPVQIAIACQAVGFDLAVPASWGDELTADLALRALDGRKREPVVLASCPHVRQRLLAAGPELTPLLVNVPPGPVALARYLRGVYGARVQHLAYVGKCPAARPPEFDTVHSPGEFLEMLHERGIDASRLPDYFDAVLPPDRRRFASLPGGCPTPEALWGRAGQRVLVEIEAGDFATELAQHLLSRQPLVIDVACTLGCACSGVTGSSSGRSARIAVMSLEPPRSHLPVIDTPPAPFLEAPVARRPNGPPDPPLRDEPRNYTPPAVVRLGLPTQQLPDNPVGRSNRAPLAVTPQTALAAIDPAVIQTAPPTTPHLPVARVARDTHAVISSGINTPRRPRRWRMSSRTTFVSAAGAADRTPPHLRAPHQRSAHDGAARALPEITSGSGVPGPGNGGEPAGHPGLDQSGLIPVSADRQLLPGPDVSTPRHHFPHRHATEERPTTAPRVVVLAVVASAIALILLRLL